MAAAGSFVKEYCQETTCPICLEHFRDPVFTECGHNFCRGCLIKSWKKAVVRKTSCPECREIIERKNLKPNRKLASFVEITKKFSLQEAEGARGVCEAHQEPLKLFCRDDEAPICLVCDKSKEHQEHRVIPVEEAVEEYEERILAQLQSLKEGREKLEEQKEAEGRRTQECLKKLEEEKQGIKSIFKKMRDFLEKEECNCLTDLEELELEIKIMQEKNINRLCRKISHFSDLIKDVLGKCQEPPSGFLQDIRGTLSRCQDGVQSQRLELSGWFEWSLRSASLKTSILENAMEELEGSLRQGLSQESMKQAPSGVSVTLDRGTAHPYFCLSEDLKRVDWAGPYENLPENAGRFDCNFYVLGQETFTSGRYCWEVTVRQHQDEDEDEDSWTLAGPWAVGVASDTVREKGQVSLSPDKGIWAVGMDSFCPNAVWAYTSPERTLLSLCCYIIKVRIFLDYEEGRVEFFFSDADNLMFTFPPASFSGEGIRPYFQLFSNITIEC